LLERAVWSVLVVVVDAADDETLELSAVPYECPVE
jgi:hypothetical protein